MSLTLPELQIIRDALIHSRSTLTANDAIKIVIREIHQMKQDQLLSESGANPT